MTVFWWLLSFENKCSRHLSYCGFCKQNMFRGHQKFQKKKLADSILVERSTKLTFAICETPEKL